MPPDVSRISCERLPELVARAPKAELHVHIEGTLEPAHSIRDRSTAHRRPAVEQAYTLLWNGLESSFEDQEIQSRNVAWLDEVFGAFHG